MLLFNTYIYYLTVLLGCFEPVPLHLELRYSSQIPSLQLMKPLVVGPLNPTRVNNRSGRRDPQARESEKPKTLNITHRPTHQNYTII